MQLIFHPDAEKEARQAAEYYEMKEFGLGNDFQKELREVLLRIEANPFLYAIESHGVRFAPMRRFPYSLIYRVKETIIFIGSVGHQKRRPYHWLTRMPSDS